MAREPHIPLFLWVATAVLVHLLGGGGADQAAEVLSERLDVQRFASAVRGYVRARAKPVEVALLSEEELPEELRDTDPPEVDEPEVADQVDPGEASPEVRNPSEEPPKPPKTEPEEPDDTRSDPKVEPPEPKKKDKKKDEKKKEEKKAEPPEDLPSVKVPNRVAVKQHVEDENQEDNPEAEFIGDHANHVTEQTQARITATDQNDPTPTPGSSHGGPPSQPGNSHVTDIAHSRDTEGDIDKAPSEKPAGEVNKAYQPPSAAAKGGGNPNADTRDAQLEPKAGADTGKDSGDPKSVDPARQAQDALAASQAVEETPAVTTAPGGTDTALRAREAQAAQRGRRAQERRLPPRKGRRGSMDFLGLGASGKTRGGLNLNLSHEQAVAAVGQDQLAREREADGARRRSKHRGSWRSLGIERWRAAIENYNSTVKPGNQTALNTARVPFAGYLNHIHNRLHPIFADSFLASLDSLPPEHPLNRDGMKTNLEIVLDQNDGKVVRMGVTRSSGSTVFDIAALESVQSASPFGRAPSIIASSDGNVYLHWEFHRNRYYACSTYFARPYKIKVDSQPAPPTIPTPEIPPTRHGDEPQRDREGRLETPSQNERRHASR